MADETTNPLAPCLWAAFDRLNILNGLAHHLRWQLDAFTATARPALEKRKAARGNSEAPVLFSGISLVVSDLTEWPPDGFRRNYASGGFGTREDKYLALADVMVRRNAAWAVAQGWEAHETFLFDVLASYLEGHLRSQACNKITAHSKRWPRSDKTQDWRDVVAGRTAAGTTRRSWPVYARTRLTLRRARLKTIGSWT